MQVTKWELEARATVRHEDDGRAAIAEVFTIEQGPVFVRIQSWVTDASHEFVESLDDKMVRVTVQVFE